MSGIQSKIQDGTVKLLVDLKDPGLTLTQETAPVLPEYTSAFGSAGDPKNTQTLRAVAANIVSAIGDYGPFETPDTFRQYANELKQADIKMGGGLYSAMSELEQAIRGDPTPVLIESPDEQKLYIWVAVANLDVKPEEAIVPLLSPTEEDAVRLSTQELAQPAG